MKFIDMHTHSTFSDGIFSPGELVDYVKRIIRNRITDHDTVDGIEGKRASGHP